MRYKQNNRNEKRRVAYNSARYMISKLSMNKRFKYVYFYSLITRADTYYEGIVVTAKKSYPPTRYQ